MLRPMAPVLRAINRTEEPGPAIVRQAAEWLAHLESGDASEADHQALEAWRRADPAHAIALDRLSGMRERLDAAPAVERETLRRLLPRPTRRAMARPFLGILALIGVGLVTSRLPIVQLHLADEKTILGETRIVTLSDGSKLTLSTETAVNIDITPSKRTVHLLRGAILAHAAKGGRTAFTVETDDGTAVALGTAYTVRKDTDATIVAVAESHVRICPAAGDDSRCLTLAPGQRGRVTRRTAERLSDVPIADVGAWAEGWLSVEDRPLVEILAELNLWRTTPIAFDQPSLADLRVSGIFPLRDTDKAVVNLGRLLPIDIDRSDPAAPVIRRR